MASLIQTLAGTPETLSAPGAEERKSRRKLAELLMEQGAQTGPIQHWTQGLARISQALTGGYLSGQADREERASEEKLAKLLGADPRLGGGAPAPSAAQPTALPAPPPTNVASTGEPRGIRNNNPLNIEAGSFTQGQPGFAGSDGRFARFQSPDQGIAAAGNLLDVYGRKHGLNTVAGIINRWAPPSDNNNTSAYAATVAKELGVDPNAPLDLSNPETKQRLIMAMGKVENGRPIQMAQATTGGVGGAPAPTAAPQVNPAMAGYIKQLIANPQTRAYGQQLLNSLEKPNQPTDEMREYELARRQGYNKDFVSYKTDLAKAKAQNINIDQKAEGMFKGESGKLQAKRFNELVEGGMTAQTAVADLNALREIGSRITTGKRAEIQAALGPYAEALGMKIDGLDDMQAYNSIVSRMAPQMRAVGSGATSDFEMRQFLQALPSLGKSPGGNELVAKTMESIAQHKIAAAEIASRAMAGEITPQDAERELRKLPDPLTLWKKSRKGEGEGARQAQPQQGAQIEEGRTATNPQTGQKIIFRNGQWTPAQGM